MIPFNRPPYIGAEDTYVLQAMRSAKMSGDGPFAKQSEQWLEQRFGSLKALLTPSCTHALEMAALLLDIQAGDEVIMPSYTFVSTANAFVLRGAKIVFVDIRPDTMNLDETQIEAAITSRTRAIAPVHYAGVSCDMDVINAVAQRHDLFVVEDAAQGILSRYRGKALGALGHMGAFSFHETKNYTSGGEGGALLVNDARFKERAEILREKGTNRSQFFRGMVDKYSWVDIGSSYLPGELQAAYLYAQLEHAQQIFDNRMASWNYYRGALQDLADAGRIDLPFIPSDCEHNAHMFYLKAKDLDERSRLLSHLKANGVGAVFHYVPLHDAPGGLKYGRFFGQDVHTTRESERLIRLPLWYGLKESELSQVVDAVRGFYA